jgi:hypothetical protein
MGIDRLPASFAVRISVKEVLVLTVCHIKESKPWREGSERACEG